MRSLFFIIFLNFPTFFQHLRLCPILVDPKNIEAVAAAFILQALLRRDGAREMEGFQ